MNAHEPDFRGWWVRHQPFNEIVFEGQIINVSELDYEIELCDTKLKIRLAKTAVEFDEESYLFMKDNLDIVREREEKLAECNAQREVKL